MTAVPGLDPVDHLQEDIVENVYRVVCYRHEAARCDDCGRLVHRLRANDSLSDTEQATKKAWLQTELSRLETCDVHHEKAITLQARLLRHLGEWLVFLDDSRVPPTNNQAERDLRPLVVLRKITFGHRSDAGANRMAALMTVGETARRRGHRVSDIYFELFTRPPDRVLRRLYADA